MSRLARSLGFLSLAIAGVARGQQSAATAPSAAKPPPAEFSSDPAANATPGPTTGPSSDNPFETSGPASPKNDNAPELMLFNDMPVIVAAGKREQTQQQAAASVTVIDAEQINQFGYRSLADVLRDQRSFYLTTDGLNWFAGVRGFLRGGEWNSRILVTIDGRPQNEIIFGQSHLDEDFAGVPVEAMKQVEIVRGPGSALYGTNAVFGVVNVVTRSGSDVNGIEAKLTGGTKDTGRLVVLGGGAIDGWDVIAGVTGYVSDGDRDIIFDGVNSPALNYGHIRNSDGENVESAFIKARKGEFTAQLDFADRDKGNRSGTYEVSFSDPGLMHEQRGNLTLRVDHEIDSSQSVHALAYVGHYLYRQNYELLPDPLTHTPGYSYTSTAQDEWAGEEIYYDLQAGKSLHVLAGVNAIQSFYALQRDYDQIHGNDLNIPASYNTQGIFTDVELKVTDSVSVAGGIRMDQIQRVGINVSPRLSAIWNVDKEDTVKLLYGRAFRTPNLYEQLYASAGYNAPNLKLSPETADTMEAVWERQFDNGWRTSLDGFVWRMKNAMESVTLPNGDIQVQNGPTLWAHGAEAEVQRKLPGGGRLDLFASYTWVDHEGTQLDQSPSWIVGGAVALPIHGQTILAIEPQIIAPMKSADGQYTRTSFITNVVLTSKDLISGWEFQAGLYNLFSNYARLPNEGALEQAQPTLNYPRPELQISISHRF